MKKKVKEIMVAEKRSPEILSVLKWNIINLLRDVGIFVFLMWAFGASAIT